MESRPMIPGQAAIEDEATSKLPPLVAIPALFGNFHIAPRIGRITSPTFQ
jgi:hypothetical protein